MREVEIIPKTVEEVEGIVASISPAVGRIPDPLAWPVGVATTVAQYDCRLPTVTIEPGIVLPAPGTKRRRVQRLG